MPWQEQVALVGGEIDPDTGLPAYREVMVTVPRQSGKTTLILAWEVQRALGWPAPQRILYSAQTGNDARKKLIEDQIPILEARKAQLGIRRMLKGMGNEAVEFRNGSRIVLMASGDDSGHGKTLDLGVKDELFADVDERRDQAMVPAMATRASAQMLTASTMGTAGSFALNRAVERGRQAVVDGRTSGIAYFEWSAARDADPDDPAVWAACMPALGLTVTPQVVQHARDTLTVAEFRRAFLNITDGRRGDPLISEEAWAACLDKQSGLTGTPVFALDVSPDRAWSSIGVAGTSTHGGIHIEVIERRPGTAWLPERSAELQTKWGGKAAVAVGSPAWSLEPDLIEAKIDILPITSQEYGQACGGFFNDVLTALKSADGTDKPLRHIGQAELDAAVDGAGQRNRDDAWVWSRRTSTVDISPLVAVTLAHWVAQKRKRKPGIL